MEVTIREKNPGPQINIKKNDEEVLSSGKPQTDEQVMKAQGTTPSAKTEETPTE